MVINSKTYTWRLGDHASSYTCLELKGYKGDYYTYLRFAHNPYHFIHMLKELYTDSYYLPEEHPDLYDLV